MTLEIWYSGKSVRKEAPLNCDDERCLLLEDDPLYQICIAEHVERSGDYRSAINNAKLFNKRSFIKIING